MKKTVIHIIDHLGEGGSQELLCEMVRLRAKQEFRVLVVAVFQPHGSGDHTSALRSIDIPTFVLSRRSMPVHVAGFWGQLYFLRDISFFLVASAYYIGYLVALARREQATVFHAHFLFAYPLAVIAGKIRRTPVVFTIPALQSQMEAYSKLIFPMYRVCALFTDHFFTALPEDNPHLKLRVPKEKISSFLGVVDGERVCRIARFENPVVREFGLGHAPIYLSVGRFEEEKGHFDTLRAFALLHARHPDARLIILGEGRLRSAYQYFIEQHGLREAVIMPGFRSDAHYFYACADVFVRAYHYEGMNTSLQWALAYGKPIVALDNRSPNELLTHSISAILVTMGDDKAFADAFARALKDEHLRMQLGSGARNVFDERLSIRRSVEVFEGIYKTIGQRHFSEDEHS